MSDIISLFFPCVPQLYKQIAGWDDVTSIVPMMLFLGTTRCIGSDWLPHHVHIRRELIGGRAAEQCVKGFVF